MVTEDNRCSAETSTGMGMAKATFNSVKQLLVFKQLNFELLVRVIEC